MWLFVSIFIVAIFVLVEVLLVTFIWRYRRRRRERFDDGAQIHGATSLELMWTVAPVVILVLIGGFVFYKLPGVTDVPSASAQGEERLEVRVTGRQFYWQYEYRTAPSRSTRCARPSAFPCASRSPRRTRTSSTPGGSRRSEARSTRSRASSPRRGSRRSGPGVYAGQCAELCGLEHANMLASVEVLEPQEFDAWLAEREAEQAEHRARRGGVGRRLRQVPRPRRRRRNRAADRGVADPHRPRSARRARPERPR